MIQMKPRQAGRGSSHRRTMELLTQARPVRLDPLSDPVSAATALARAVQAAAGAGPAAVRPGRPRHHVHRRHAALGAGATLAATAAAAAVLMASDGLATGTASHVPTAGRAHALSAQQILLTAAVSAARQPAEGRYWRVAEESELAQAAGPNAHPYAVEQRWDPMLTWDARSPHQRTWTFPATGYRSVPASPGAAAAWRAGGSPRLPSQHSAQQAWWQTGGAVGYFGNSNLTFAQFQRLPTSPAGLAAAVQKAAEQQMAPVPRGSARHWSTVDQTTLSQNMFGVYDQLLQLDPISPAVRAAALRDLARVPGVHSIGKVTDPLGRAGYGIAQGGGPGNTEEVLVIAPRTGLLLADEFVTVRYTPPVPLPPSGAVPGLARCPKGTALPKLHKPICKLSVAQAQRLAASEGHVSVKDPDSGNGFQLVELGPTVKLAPGQMQSYNVIVSAGWTNASPPLPPRAQQFSVAKDSKG
jgi:hypothetical protein